MTNNYDTLLDEARSLGIIGQIAIAPMWEGSSANNTHMQITAKALSHYTNNSSFYSGNAAEYASIITNASKPDQIDLDANLPIRHFYHYPTKTNYIGQTSPTAKDRFYYYYNLAKEFYPANKSASFTNLSYALHYIQDISTPVHTGDSIPQQFVENFLAGIAIVSLDVLKMFAKHLEFENYMLNNCATQLTQPIYPDYSYYVSTPLDTIIENIAGASFSYYYLIKTTTNYSQFLHLLNASAEYTAGILHRFVSDVANHTHSYTHSYSQYTTSQHRAYCICGLFAYVKHSSWQYNRSSHYIDCVCGYYYSEPHEISIFNNKCIACNYSGPVEFFPTSTLGLQLDLGEHHDCEHNH